MSEHYGHWDGRKLHAETFAASVKSYPVGTPLCLTVGPVKVRKSTSQKVSYICNAMTKLRDIQTLQ